MYLSLLFQLEGDLSALSVDRKVCLQVSVEQVVHFGCAVYVVVVLHRRLVHLEDVGTIALTA